MPRARVATSESSPHPEVTARDFVMARLAAARNAYQAAIDSLDECLAMFLFPDDDKKAAGREEAISDALEAAGTGTRALESAEQNLTHIDPLEIEPWEDD